MESDYSDTRMHLEETDCHQSVDMTVEPVCSDAIEQTEVHYQCDDIAVLPVHTDTMSHLEETNEQNDDDTTTQQVYSSASIVFIETEDGQPDYSDSTDNIDICETVEVEVSNHVESETVPDILNVQVPESSSMDVEVNERIEMDDNVDMEMIVEEQFVEEIESVEILEEGKLSRMDVYAESGSMSVYTDIPSSETAVEEYAEEDLSDEYVQEQAEPSLNVNVDTHFTSSTVISSAMTAESFHAEQDHTSLSVSEKCEGTNIAGQCSSEPDPGCTFSNLEGTDGTAEETCTSQDTDREECIITSDKTDTDQVTDLNKERLTTKENFPATREDMSQSETLLDNACVLKMADQASSPQSSQHSEPQSKNQLSVLPQTDHLRPEVSHNMETESCAAESCATEAGKESENVVTAVFCQLSEDSQRVSTDAETNNTKNNVDITSGGCGADTELLSGKETADRQMDRNNEDRTDTSITHLPGRSPFQTDMRASSPSQGAHNSNDNEEIVCTSETVESLETDNRLQVVSERSYKSKKKTKHFSKTQKGADEENVLTVFQSQAERSETATEKREVTGQDLDQTHPAEDTFNTGQVFASDTDFAEHQAETIVPVSEACVNEHKEEDTREIENTIEHFETACVKAKGANSPDRKMVSEQTVQNSNVEEQRAESGKENTRVGGKRAKMTRNEVDVCSAEDGEKQQACTGMECIPDQTNTDENVFPKTKHVDSSQEKESHAESERDCSNAVVTKMVDIEGPETEILAEMGSIAAQETDTKITAAKRKSVAKVNTKTTNAVTNQENDNLEEMETAKTLVSLSVLAQNRKYMSHLSTEVSLVSSQGSHISSFHEVSVIDQTSVPTNMTNEISTARGEQAEDVEQKAETDGITETKTREFEMVTEQKAAQRSITEEGRKTVEMVNKASRKAEPQIEHTNFLVSTNCTAEEEMKSVGAAEENASIKKHPLNIPDGGAEKENRWMCTETGTINPSQENQNVCLEQVDNERIESMNLTNKEEGGSTSDRFNEQACPSTSRHFTKSLDNISFGEDLSTTENHEPRDRTQVLSKKTDLMTKTDNKPVDDTCQKRVDGNNQKINTNNKEIEMHGQSVTSAEYDEELRSSVQQLVQLMNGACTEKPREIYEETLEDSCNTDRSVSSLEKDARDNTKDDSGFFSDTCNEINDEVSSANVDKNTQDGKDNQKYGISALVQQFGGADEHDVTNKDDDGTPTQNQIQTVEKCDEKPNVPGLESEKKKEADVENLENTDVFQTKVTETTVCVDETNEKDNEHKRNSKDREECLEICDPQVKQKETEDCKKVEENPMGTEQCVRNTKDKASDDRNKESDIENNDTEIVKTGDQWCKTFIITDEVESKKMDRKTASTDKCKTGDKTNNADLRTSERSSEEVETKDSAWTCRNSQLADQDEVHVNSDRSNDCMYSTGRQGNNYTNKQLNTHDKIHDEQCERMDSRNKQDVGSTHRMETADNKLNGPKSVKLDASKATSPLKCEVHVRAMPSNKQPGTGVGGADNDYANENFTCKLDENGSSQEAGMQTLLPSTDDPNPSNAIDPLLHVVGSSKSEETVKTKQETIKPHTPSTRKQETVYTHATSIAEPHTVKSFTVLTVGNKLVNSCAPTTRQDVIKASTEEQESVCLSETPASKLNHGSLYEPLASEQQRGNSEQISTTGQESRSAEKTITEQECVSTDKISATEQKSTNFDNAPETEQEFLNLAEISTAEHQSVSFEGTPRTQREFSNSEELSENTSKSVMAGETPITVQESTCMEITSKAEQKHFRPEGSPNVQHESAQLSKISVVEQEPVMPKEISKTERESVQYEQTSMTFGPEKTSITGQETFSSGDTLITYQEATSSEKTSRIQEEFLHHEEANMPEQEFLNPDENSVAVQKSVRPENVSPTQQDSVGLDTSTQKECISPVEASKPQQDSVCPEETTEKESASSEKISTTVHVPVNLEKISTVEHEYGLEGDSVTEQDSDNPKETSATQQKSVIPEETFINQLKSVSSEVRIQQESIISEATSATLKKSALPVGASVTLEECEKTPTGELESVILKGNSTSKPQSVSPEEVSTTEKETISLEEISKTDQGSVRPKETSTTQQDSAILTDTSTGEWQSVTIEDISKTQSESISPDKASTTNQQYINLDETSTTPQKKSINHKGTLISQEDSDHREVTQAIEWENISPDETSTVQLECINPEETSIPQHQSVSPEETSETEQQSVCSRKTSKTHEESISSKETSTNQRELINSEEASTIQQEPIYSQETPIRQKELVCTKETSTNQQNIVDQQELVSHEENSTDLKSNSPQVPSATEQQYISFKEIPQIEKKSTNPEKISEVEQEPISAGSISSFQQESVSCEEISKAQEDSVSSQRTSIAEEESASPDRTTTEQDSVSSERTSIAEEESVSPDRTTTEQDSVSSERTSIAEEESASPDRTTTEQDSVSSERTSIAEEESASPDRTTTEQDSVSSKRISTALQEYVRLEGNSITELESASPEESLTTEQDSAYPERTSTLEQESVRSEMASAIEHVSVNPVRTSAKQESVMPEENSTLEQDSVSPERTSTTIQESFSPERTSTTIQESVIPERTSTTTQESVIPERTSTAIQYSVRPERASTTIQESVSPERTSTTIQESVIPERTSTTIQESVSPERTSAKRESVRQEDNSTLEQDSVSPDRSSTTIQESLRLGGTTEQESVRPEQMSTVEEESISPRRTSATEQESAGLEKASTEQESVRPEGTSATEQEPVSAEESLTAEWESVSPERTSTAEQESATSERASKTEEESVSLKMTSTTEEESVSPERVSATEQASVSPERASTTEPENISHEDTPTPQQESVSEETSKSEEEFSIPEAASTTHQKSVRPEETSLAEQVFLSSEDVLVTHLGSTDTEEMSAEEQEPISSEDASRTEQELCYVYEASAPEHKLVITLRTDGGKTDAVKDHGYERNKNDEYESDIETEETENAEDLNNEKNIELYNATTDSCDSFQDISYHAKSPVSKYRKRKYSSILSHDSNTDYNHSHHIESPSGDTEEENCTNKESESEDLSSEKFSSAQNSEKPPSTKTVQRVQESETARESFKSLLSVSCGISKTKASASSVPSNLEPSSQNSKKPLKKRRRKSRTTQKQKQRHGDTMKDETYSCSSCSETFTSKLQYWRHERQHSFNHCFVCEVCGARLTSDQDGYRGHLQEHARKDQLLQYTCRTCSQRFSSRELLDQHCTRHPTPTPSSPSTLTPIPHPAVETAAAAAAAPPPPLREPSCMRIVLSKTGKTPPVKTPLSPKKSQKKRSTVTDDGLDVSERVDGDVQDCVHPQESTETERVDGDVRDCVHPQESTETKHADIDQGFIHPQQLPEERDGVQGFIYPNESAEKRDGTDLQPDRASLGKDAVRRSPSSQKENSSDRIGVSTCVLTSTGRKSLRKKFPSSSRCSCCPDFVSGAFYAFHSSSKRKFVDHTDKTENRPVALKRARNVEPVSSMNCGHDLNGGGGGGGDTENMLPQTLTSTVPKAGTERFSSSSSNNNKKNSSNNNNNNNNNNANGHAKECVMSPSLMNAVHKLGTDQYSIANNNNNNNIDGHPKETMTPHTFRNHRGCPDFHLKDSPDFSLKDCSVQVWRLPQDVCFNGGLTMSGELCHLQASSESDLTASDHPDSSNAVSSDLGLEAPSPDPCSVRIQQDESLNVVSSGVTVEEQSPESCSVRIQQDESLNVVSSAVTVEEQSPESCSVRIQQNDSLNAVSSGLVLEEPTSEPCSVNIQKRDSLKCISSTFALEAQSPDPCSVRIRQKDYLNAMPSPPALTTPSPKPCSVRLQKMPASWVRALSVHSALKLSSAERTEFLSPASQQPKSSPQNTSGVKDSDARKQESMEIPKNTNVTPSKRKKKLGAEQNLQRPAKIHRTASEKMLPKNLAMSHAQKRRRRSEKQNASFSQKKKTSLSSKQRQNLTEEKQNNQRYTCVLCDRVFHCSSDMKIHINTHLGKTVTCGARVNSSPYFAAATTAATTAGSGNHQPCVCHRCGFQASSSSHLLRHMTLHPAKTHACQQCWLTFYTLETLQQHLRAHKRAQTQP